MPSNVNDIEKVLHLFMKNTTTIKENEIMYSGKTKMGDLHVYTDMSQPMRYVSSPA